MTGFALLAATALYSCSGSSPSGRRSHQKAHSSTPPSSRLTEKKPGRHTEDHKADGSVRDRLPLNELYDKYKKSVFLIYTSDGSNKSQGSGFFLSKNGLAASNYHVFEGTSQGLEVIKVPDGRQFRIKEVLEYSKENDYIIFRVNIENHNIFTPVPVAPQSSEIGEDVFAIGNPRGLESTLSKGIVSGFRKKNALIQTTAEITHGSSGGPLLNMKGEVIGITTSTMGEANLNFAINIKLLRLHRFLKNE